MSTPATNAPGLAAPNSMRSIWLVAEREITTRFKQRSFVITTAIMVVAIVAGIFAISLLTGGDNRLRVATVDQEIASQIDLTTTAIGMDVVTSVVSDPALAEALINDGEIDAFVSPAAGGSLDVMVESTVNHALYPVLHGLAQQRALIEEVSAQGGDAGAVAAAMGSATVNVNALQPPPEVDPPQLLAGIFIGFLMFFSIMICSQMVAIGTVEEKTSRVIELLLSTIKPIQLLAGKVLGIGIVGLVQILLTVGAGAITANLTGVLDETGLELGSTVVWALIWYIVGYATFAVLTAALASLVSRQEEVSSVIFPVQAYMMVPYFVAVQLLPMDPANNLANTLSYIPGMSPFIMPLRHALGVVSTGEQLIALAISLAAVPLMLWIGAKIYSNSVLRTGARIKLKDALASS
jgi:ABC-2 type transport system permease protein